MAGTIGRFLHLSHGAPVMAKKKAPPAKAVKKSAGKKAPKKPIMPAQHAGSDHDHSQCDHDHADTFQAIYDVSPGLVVLFDAMIHYQGGSDKVTLGEVRECLQSMNE